MIAPSRVFLTSFLSILMLTACNGSGSGSAGVSSSGTGHIQVHLTDAPIDMTNVATLDVVIDGVIVYGAMLADGSEPVPVQLMSHPEMFDLLTLTGGVTELLADGEVASGLYDRIRLEISSATMTLTDGTIEALKIDSNKVDVPVPFEVGADETMAVTLDFQADQSVQVNQTGNGKYILRPVITPVQGR